MIPLVSVIIPTYKRSNYIIRAINSVINQTYKNIEIIVVDDNELNNEFSIATENKLKEFIRKGKVLYIKHNNNRGVSAARNTGIEKAQGKYIAFLDDDDEFYPDKTKLQVDILNNSRENVGLVYGACLKVDVDNELKEIIVPKIYGDVYDVLGINYIGTPSMVMVTKEVIEKIKGFDVSLDHKEDIDLKKHQLKMKKPRLRWSELQERLGELYVFNENKKKALYAYVSAYINRPLHFTILIKICLLFLGKKIFSYKKNILKHLKSSEKIFKK